MIQSKPISNTPANDTEGTEIFNQKVNRYKAYDPVGLKDRTWPDAVIEKAPIWCSVDLRDGNQALTEPMDSKRKLTMFESLIQIGFKEIEVGFPAASETDLSFVRHIIEQELIPTDVKIQILCQAREELLRKTFDALADAPTAILHLYNSTSTLQRKVVFEKSRDEIKKLATDHAKLVLELANKNTDKYGTVFDLEYSPESFTGTELDFAVEVCNEVIEVWDPARHRIIINLPATVEMSTPNIYADQIEWMHRNLTQRENIVLSLHPHNDRGSAVAAAELGLMAGADRIEGTLFGNGERTGNVCNVTLALNMFSQGVAPNLDFSDMLPIVRMAESCNNLPVPPRHPYGGDLVFTAFSGSHQDAIKKGFSALKNSNQQHWEVPYLPIDPRDIGRDYKAVIRVNSQSGKGGAAWIMEQDYGMTLPRRLQISFSSEVQKEADATGKEIVPSRMMEIFDEHFINPPNKKYSYLSHTIIGRGESEEEVTVLLSSDKGETVISGRGNGPIAAFINGLIKRHPQCDLNVIDYAQHSIATGSEAEAVAYIELHDRNRQGEAAIVWGVGTDTNTTVASLKAITAGLNKLSV